MLAVALFASQLSRLMQSIGERLEEARKRKGISLREAAEATKIRGDFLASIEQNKFDFDLPDIYKRGFLKNYARYLKLDEEKLIADYNSQQLSDSRLGKRAANEWFGSMELKRDEAEGEEQFDQENDPSSPSFGRIRAKASSLDEDSNSESASPEETDQAFYLKIGLIFVGTLAVVFIVFGLIWAVLGGSNRPDEAVTTPSPVEALEEPAAANDTSTSVELATETITLIASGNVYVLVKQKNDDQEIFRKTMAEGETADIDKQGPVDILFTAGEFLTIDHNGERMRPSSSGTAKITIP